MRLRQTPAPQTALARAVGHEPYMGTMILAPAARHRAGRPAMSMEGGKTYGAAFACRRLIRGRKNTFHRETHFMGFRGEKTKKEESL